MRLELTRRCDYAIRAVIVLARHAPEVIGASRLAAEAGIPRRFVPEVMAQVVRSGIAEARLGRAGGYRIGRPAGDISVLDVVIAVEGDVRRHACVLRNAPCGSGGTCDLHGVFRAAQDALLLELRRATIAGVLASSAAASSAASASPRAAATSSSTAPTP